MSGGAMIGRHRAEDLAHINDPISQYYIPYPADTMTCAQLQFNFEKLEQQIAQWIDWRQYETNATAQNNIDQIVTIQTEKQTQYQTKISVACATTPPPGGAVTDPKNNSMLWIIAAAAGALILFGGKIFGKKQTAR